MVSSKYIYVFGASVPQPIPNVTTKFKNIKLLWLVDGWYNDPIAVSPLMPMMFIASVLFQTFKYGCCIAAFNDSSSNAVNKLGLSCPKRIPAGWVAGDWVELQHFVRQLIENLALFKLTHILYCSFITASNGHVKSVQIESGQVKSRLGNSRKFKSGQVFRTGQLRTEHVGTV